MAHEFWVWKPGRLHQVYVNLWAKVPFCLFPACSRYRLVNLPSSNRAPNMDDGRYYFRINCSVEICRKVWCSVLVTHNDPPRSRMTELRVVNHPLRSAFAGRILHIDHYQPPIPRLWVNWYPVFTCNHQLCMSGNWGCECVLHFRVSTRDGKSRLGVDVFLLQTWGCDCPVDKST